MLDYYEVNLIEKKKFETVDTLIFKDLQDAKNCKNKFESKNFIVGIAEVRKNIIYMSNYDVKEIEL